MGGVVIVDELIEGLAVIGSRGDVGCPEGRV